jgi:Zn-dependent peptidase ImmA (M78 family)/DNA-binding XRE family transcriptional regulator
MPDHVDIDKATLERLRAARKRRGLTQESAAAQLDMARTTVVAIEKGERPLRADELVRLAELYHVPVSELLRTAPPPSDFTVAFRLPPERETLAAEMERAAALLQQLADDYVELEKITGAQIDQTLFPPVTQPTGNPETFGQALAASERNRLGLGDASVLRLRELLDSDVGLRTFALWLPSPVAGLYIYSELHGPCIAINADHPHERQRWSLAHEYAHFLTSRDRPEVTVLHQYTRVPANERMADAFAEAFLIPRTRLTRRFHDIQRMQGRIAPADLLALAAYFEVSFQAIAVALEDARLLPSGTWDRLSAQGFRPEEGRRMLDLGTIEPDQRLLPPRYERLAARAYWAGTISEGKLAAFLHVDRVAARRRVADLGRGLGLDEEGERTTVELGRLTELDLASSRGR